MKMRKFLIIITVLFAGLCFVSGTGKLKRPPGRSTLWRYFGGYGYELVANYDDGNLNCGGKRTNGDLTGVCGVCGDDYDIAKKPNSYINPANTTDRGAYVTGIPGYLFQTGSTVNFTVQMDSGSVGFFKFEICSLPNANTAVNENCFQPLLVNGSTTYILPYQDSSSSGMDHNVTVELPSAACNYCVVRWTWVKVYCDENGCPSTNEATFVNCADVKILSDPNYTTAKANFKFPKYNDPYASIHGEEHGGGGGHGHTTSSTTLKSGGLNSPTNQPTTTSTTSTTVSTTKPTTTLKTGGLNSPPVITNPPTTTKTTTKSTTSTTASTTKSTTTLKTGGLKSPPVIIDPTVTTKATTTKTPTTTLKSGGLNSPPVITNPPTTSTTTTASTAKTTLKTAGMGGGSGTTHHNWQQTTAPQNGQTTKSSENWHTTQSQENWHTTKPSENWHKSETSGNWFGKSSRSGFIKLILFLSLLGFGRNSNQPASITWMPYYWQRNQQPGYGYATPGLQKFTGYGNGYINPGNGISGYGYRQTYTGYGQMKNRNTYTGYGNHRIQNQVSYNNRNSVFRRATSNHRPQNRRNYQIPKNVPRIPRPSLSAHGPSIQREYDVEPATIKNKATAIHNIQKIGGNQDQCQKGFRLECQTKKGLNSGIMEWICRACTQWTDDQPCPSDICDCQCIGKNIDNHKNK